MSSQLPEPAADMVILALLYSSVQRDEMLLKPEQIPLMHAGYTSLGMALALPEGGTIDACDISSQYPAVGKASASCHCITHP